MEFVKIRVIRGKTLVRNGVIKNLDAKWTVLIINNNVVLFRLKRKCPIETD
jgi:hypothetical protein